MMADYWVLRDLHLNLNALYRHPDIYSFFKGFNLRAFAAFVTGIAPNLAGLARATGQNAVPIGATYVYSLSWLVGTVVAFVVYLVLGKIWPVEDRHDELEVVDGVESSIGSMRNEEEKGGGVKTGVPEKGAESFRL